MAKESLIRKKAVDILTKDKWVIWWPAKVKFKQNDIFGIFDLACCKKGTGDIKFIQLTTAPNLSARRKKIQFFMAENQIKGPKASFGAEVEIWAWAAKRHEFRIETI